MRYILEAFFFLGELFRKVWGGGKKSDLLELLFNYLTVHVLTG